MSTNAAPETVVASAARATTGQSAANKIGVVGTLVNREFLNLLVDVTAASGTPTLDLTVEWSHDSGTTWAAGDTSDAFTQITGTTVVVKQFSVKAPDYRIVWTIGGSTPSFTFSVSEFLTGAVA